MRTTPEKYKYWVEFTRQTREKKNEQDITWKKLIDLVSARDANQSSKILPSRRPIWDWSRRRQNNVGIMARSRKEKNGEASTMKNYITLVRNCLFPFLGVILFLAGCESPEQKTQDESVQIEALQKKAIADQEYWRQVLAPYTNEQLVVKVQELEQAIQRGTQGENILLAKGNNLGFSIAQGEVEKRLKNVTESSWNWPEGIVRPQSKLL